MNLNQIRLIIELVRFYYCKRYKIENKSTAGGMFLLPKIDGKFT